MASCQQHTFAAPGADLLTDSPGPIGGPWCCCASLVGRWSLLVTGPSSAVSTYSDEVLLLMSGLGLGTAPTRESMRHKLRCSRQQQPPAAKSRGRMALAAAEGDQLEPPTARGRRATVWRGLMNAVHLEMDTH
jgi:hypothetical protein